MNNDEDGYQAAATPATEERRRYTLRRRRSYPKDDDDDGSCKSTMAATADEALFEPSTKTFKPDSPGEARNIGPVDASLEAAASASSTNGASDVEAEKSNFDSLSEEIILEIFSKMFEKDLYNLSLVCRRFHRLANDTKLWKRLYEETFEYAIPLQRLQYGRFDFRPPQRWRSYLNPWCESFKQLVSIHIFWRVFKKYFLKKIHFFFIII